MWEAALAPSDAKGGSAGDVASNAESCALHREHINKNHTSINKKLEVYDLNIATLPFSSTSKALCKFWGNLGPGASLSMLLTSAAQTPVVSGDTLRSLR